MVIYTLRIVLQLKQKLKRKKWNFYICVHYFTHMIILKKKYILSLNVICGSYSKMRFYFKKKSYFVYNV